LNNSWSILANRIYEPAINPGEYNHLAVSARGKVLYFYINDTLVSTIENSGTDSGHIGLILKIINGNVSISYDNFLEQGIK
jgi:hypothetical protein